MLKIEFAGRTWAYEAEDISLKQAKAITGYMGTTITGWEKVLENLEDPKWLDAIACLHWLLLAQDGQQGVIGEEDFAVLKFAQAVVEAVGAEQAAVAEPDPTSSGAPSAAGSPGLPAASLPG